MAALDAFLAIFASHAPPVRGCGDVTWSHATNSLAQLHAALAGGVHMVEADILMGASGSRIDIPIMAHPPQTSSDLCFDGFLRAVAEHNAAVGPYRIVGLSWTSRTPRPCGPAAERDSRPRRRDE